MTIEKEKLRGYALAVLAGTAASTLMFLISGWGPGISPDSVTYIEAARNILAGRGFWANGQPVTHFPPAYPVLLSLTAHVTGGDVLNAARLLCILLFGVNTALLGTAVLRGTGFSLGASGLAMLFFLCSPLILIIHYMAWTESLFMALLLSCIILACSHFNKPNRLILAASALCASLAFGMRYAGASLAPPFIAALFLFRRRPLRQTAVDAAIFTIIAVGPMALWFLRNIYATNSAAGRSLTFHPVNFIHFKAFVATMQEYAINSALPPWSSMCVVFLLALIIFCLSMVVFEKEQIRIGAVLGGAMTPFSGIIFILGYLLFIAISISFFDAHTPVNPRIMFPAQTVIVMVVFSIAFRAFSAMNNSWLYYICLFGVIALTAFNGFGTLAKARFIRNNGLGYTAVNCRTLQSLAYLKELSDDITIYSNGPDLIKIHTNKQAKMIPCKVFPGTGGVNEVFEEQMDFLARECINGRALVMFFVIRSPRWYLPGIEEFHARTGLPVSAAFPKGVLFGGRPPEKAREQSPES